MLPLETLPHSVAPAVETVPACRHDQTSWGAILAGVAAALVTQLLLSMLGVGIGFVALNPGAVHGDAAMVSATGALLWWVVAGSIGAAAGGLTAGRLAGVAHQSTAHWHGLVTWCASTLVVVALLGSAVGGILGGAYGALGRYGKEASGMALSTTAASPLGDEDGLVSRQVRQVIDPAGSQTVQESVATYLKADLAGDHTAAAIAKTEAVDSLSQSAHINQAEAQGSAGGHRGDRPTGGRIDPAAHRLGRRAHPRGRGDGRLAGLRGAGAWRGCGLVRRRAGGQAGAAFTDRYRPQYQCQCHRHRSRALVKVASHARPYAASGKPGPMAALVLLPGMDGTGRLLAGFARTMGVDCHVVAYPHDLPLDYPALAAFVRERLPVNGPFVLLAESFSGPIALALAADAPPGLVALVLVCSFVTSPMPALVNAARHLIPWVPLRPTPTRVLSRLLHGRFHTPETWQEFDETLRLVAETVLKTRVREVLGADLRHTLQHIKVPILYLQAGQDRLVWRKCARLIRQHHPATRVVTLDGPHFLLQTRPMEAATAIQHFLADEGIGLTSTTG